MRSLVVVLATLLLPVHALAWADATVRSASARVSIDESAHAHVVVDATLRIDGGWLEALELDGLDEGLTLDPSDPVTMVPISSEDDLAAGIEHAPLSPAVSLRDDGVVVLAFVRRHAPRRGDYAVHLAYDADLSGRARAEVDGAHVPWTFPAWRHGLDSVRVELALPAGVEPALEADDEIEVARTEDADGVVWTLTRAHLARTREWPIDLRWPEGTLAVALAPLEAEPTPLAHETPNDAPRPPWQGGIALALASLWVALRIMRTSSLRGRERTTLPPLLPLPVAVRALGALALGAACMGVALVGQSSLWLAGLALGIVLLGRSRVPLATVPRLGSFRHVTPSLRAAARRARLHHWLGLDAWLDATTLPGFTLLALLALLASRAPAGARGAVCIALAIVVCSALDGARASRPEPALVALHRLLAFARAARVTLSGPAIALMPVLHLDVEGYAQEARLRVGAALPEGTLRADVVITRTTPFGARFALLVVVARGSDVDRALEGCTAFEPIAIGNERIARMLPIDRTGIDGAIARLLEITRSAERDAPADETTIAA